MLENRNSKPCLTAPKEKNKVMSSPNDLQGVFGHNVKMRRIELGMTQDDLANKAYVSVDTIKRYERGTISGAQLCFAYYIAKALNTTIDHLLLSFGNSQE